MDDAEKNLEARSVVELNKMDRLSSSSQKFNKSLSFLKNTLTSGKK
jgi:hypothetical protein